jgi:hypothetical protein
MLHLELATYLATSGIELHLIEKCIWLQVFQLKKGLEVQHVQISATCDSLLLEEKQPNEHFARESTPDIYFWAVLHTFHNAVRLL